MIKWRGILVPAGDEGRVDDFERLCCAVEIDKHDVAPDMGADLDQTEFVLIDVWMGVVARSADVGRGDQRAFGRITP